MIARIVDGSRFDEFKALYGETLVTGKLKQMDFCFQFQTVMCDIQKNSEQILVHLILKTTRTDWNLFNQSASLELL